MKTQKQKIKQLSDRKAQTKCLEINEKEIMQMKSFCCTSKNMIWLTMSYPKSTVLQPYLLRKTKQKSKVLLLSLFVVAFRPSLRLPLSIVSYFLCYTTVLREILPSSDSGKTTSAKCQLSNSASLLAHVFPRFATAASNLIGSFDRLIQF